MSQSTWEQRASLGERLAPCVGEAGVDARLLALLLDPDDTAVTYRTAIALLNEHSTQALRLIVLAKSRADDNTRDWIEGAFTNLRADTLGACDEFLARALVVLGVDADPVCRETAQDLLQWLDLDRGA